MVGISLSVRGLRSRGSARLGNIEIDLDIGRDIGFKGNGVSSLWRIPPGPASAYGIGSDAGALITGGLSGTTFSMQVGTSLGACEIAGGRSLLTDPIMPSPATPSSAKTSFVLPYPVASDLGVGVGCRDKF